MAAAVFAVVEEGDEVVLLDPAYETYESCIILAGGTPVWIVLQLDNNASFDHVNSFLVGNCQRYLSLDPPQWSLDVKKLEGAFNPKTKAIIINSPHNPTGKVFSSTEPAAIAALCCKYDCLAISDEQYMVALHVFEGWRIGWAIAPPAISAAIGNIHVKLTDSAPAPFQEAALVALQSSPSFYTQLKQEYEMRRDFVCKILHQAGFTNFLRPQGSFVVFAELPKEYPRNDVEYVAELIKGSGVAIVPGCGFFHEDSMRKPLHQLGYRTPHNEQGVAVNSCKATNNPDEIYKARYVRVAFCKDMATLRAADIAFRRHWASSYLGR